MESQELGEEDKSMVRNHPLYRKLWPLYKPSQKKVSFWCFFIICFLETRLRLLRLNTIVFQIQAKSHHWRPILILCNGSCSYSGREAPPPWMGRRWFEIDCISFIEWPYDSVICCIEARHPRTRTARTSTSSGGLMTVVHDQLHIGV